VNDQKNKGLIILSQYFYPDLASTGQLLTELAEDFKKYGYNVKVYTVKPSYFKSTKKCDKKETYKSIKIYRVSATRFNKNILMGRLCNYLSYFISVSFKLLFSKDRYPLLIVSNPPFLPLIGLLLKRIRNQKYIFLIHDLYPDLAIKLGYIKQNSIIAIIWKKLNGKIFKKANEVVVLGKYMAERIKKSNINLDFKIKIIDNWADEKSILPVRKEENWFIKKYNLKNKMVILYSGNIGLYQDLKIILKAANILRNYEKLLFLFIGEGGGIGELKKIVNEYKLHNVKFLPFQPKEFLSYSLSVADISIVALEKGVEGINVPSKIYGILASGRAILGLVGENCEVADIIKKANCGFRIDQGDISGLVEKIKYIYERPEKLKIMGNNSRKYFENHFTRAQVTKKYFKILENI